MRTLFTATASLSTLLFLSMPASAATLTVGPSGMYTTPCAAIAIAADNDIIEIDTQGTYAKDYCVINKNGLTLRGSGDGRAKIDAKLEGVEQLPAGDGIWVINGNDTTVEKVELTGAKQPTKKKGAGIRLTGNNLTVVDCSFHDNDTGIITADKPTSELTIQGSEFGHNGTFTQDTPSHIAVGRIAKFTLHHSYLHHALLGTMLISNAEETHILYSRITSELDGASGASLDLPLGGRTYIIGNLFQRSMGDQSNKMVLYRLAQGTLHKSDELFVVNNTFVSDTPAIMIETSIDPATGTLPIVRNNIFDVPGMVMPVFPSEALEPNNFQGDAQFVGKAKLDFHLLETSPAVDKGAPPGMGGDIDLTPVEQYVHTGLSEPRPIDDPIDIGAFEIPPPVQGAGGGGGGGGGGSSGGAGGAGGEGQGGKSVSSSSSSSSTGAGGSADGGEEGCNCHTGDTGSSPNAGLMALAMAFLYGARRRFHR